MVLKLNDPAVDAFRRERCALYQKLAEEALAREGLPLDQALVEKLVLAAWELECGGLPLKARDEFLEKSVRDLQRSYMAQARRVQTSLDKFAQAANESGQGIRNEIALSIERAGISLTDFSRALDAIRGRLLELQDVELDRFGPARPKTLRSEWILQLWPLLSAAGMRPAARIIAHVFDGNDDNVETIYQAIRNHEQR